MSNRDHVNLAWIRPASLAVAIAVGLVTVMVAFPSATHADVSAVEGSAYGYWASVSLFGGPANTRGPAPTVTLPPEGSAVPITDTAASGLVQFGPAILFSSGPITVSTQGTTGPTGSVTSATTVDTVNTSGQEVFTAANVASTCTASETGVTGATTITGGTLQISEGNPDVEGDETVVQIPVNPTPNTTYEGQIETVGDSFRYVFNEQIVDPDDGSFTVNAAHLYLLGPTAVGDLIIGQSVCGVEVTATTTTVPTTTLPPTTTVPTTTLPPTTTVPTTTLPPTTTVPTTTTTVPTSDPQSHEDCKDGGWEDYGFRNQGQCIRFVNTGEDSRTADDDDGSAAMTAASPGDSILDWFVSVLQRIF